MMRQAAVASRRAQRGSAQGNADEHCQLSDQHRQSIFCYLLGTILMLLSDFKDCYPKEQPNPHAVNEKYWIIIFL